MVKVRLDSYAFLSNVDETIEKVALPEGFSLGSIDFRQLPSDLMNKLFRDYTNMSLFNEFSKLHIITGYTAYYVHLTEEGDVDDSNNIQETFVISSKLSHRVDSLYNKLNLLKLYYECDVRIPFYRVMSDKSGRLETTTNRNYISFERLRVNEVDADRISFFLRSVEPPKNSLLLDVFHYLEQSYMVPYPELCFLMLMICMEILFSPSTVKVMYRMSKNCAILLGENKEDSGVIFSRVKTLYDARCKYVHSGEKDGITLDDIHYVRGLVRRSIVALNSLPVFDKKVVLSQLDSMDFGDGKKIIR